MQYNKNKANRIKHSSLFSFLILLLLLPTLSPIAAPAYDAEIKSLNVEKNLIVKKSYNAVLEVKNTGSQTWTQNKDVALKFTSASSRSIGLPTKVNLNSGESVKPGQSRIFKFKITAPSKTGFYTLQAKMSQGGKTFGEASKTVDLVVETHVHRVKFISQLLPETMETGQEYNVVVQFKNTGSATWDRSKGYKLGIRSGKKAWNLSRVKLDNSSVVTTNDLATFRFSLKAPDKAGIYPVQWQMLRGNKWFGEKTPIQHVSVKEITSSSGAEFVYQDIPSLSNAGKPFAIFERGEVYQVALTFKNTSDESWVGGRFSLNAQNPPNSLTWSVDRVELKNNETVKAGNFKTFSFKIIAPLKPGIYNFQWQMVKGFNSWVGEKSENVSITVK